MIHRNIERHAESASFLWLLRDNACTSPSYSLADLRELDERVEAHLDGLRVAGKYGRDACRDVLPLEDAGEVFTSAELALELQAHDEVARLLDATVDDFERSRGILAALAWTPLVRAQTMLEAMVDPRCPPALSYFGIAGFACHRHDPGDVLQQAAYSPDVRLRARALRAAAELGRRDLGPVLREELTGSDPTTRFWAAWSATLLGDRAATDTLWSIAWEGGEHLERATDLAARASDPGRACAELDRLVARPDRVRAAVIGLAALGDPTRATTLLDLLDVPEVSRLAAEALGVIGGLDLRAGLEGAAPSQAPASPNDDPGDDRVALDPDADRPWPAPTVLREAWSKLAPTLPRGGRLMLGRNHASGVLGEVLAAGNQSLRRAAALELALARPGAPLCEVRAPAFRQ